MAYENAFDRYFVRLVFSAYFTDLQIDFPQAIGKIAGRRPDAPGCDVAVPGTFGNYQAEPGHL
jgi:hypothetical protein